MNDDRVFRSKKEFLLYLLALEMPNYVIEQALEVSGATVNNYKRKVIESGEWKGSQVEKGRELPHLLQTYAKKLDQVRKLSDFDKMLLPVLKETLRLDDVKDTLKYGMRALAPLMYPICSNDVMDEYQKLIQDIVNLDTRYMKLEDAIELKGIEMADQILGNYLYAIRMGEVNLPKQHELHFGATGHFMNDLLKAKADEIRREKLAPMFSEEIVQFIDYAVDALPEQQANLIVLKYGLAREHGMRLADIKDEFKITWRKAKDLQYKALKSIKESLQKQANFDLHVSNAWGLLHDVNMRMHALLVNRPIAVEDNITILDVNPDILTRKINDYGFSARVRNFLIGVGIDYVWQLTELTELELSKFRNLGPLSINEINEFLKENSLELGTKYTEETLKNLKALTTEKEGTQEWW